jgi:hypothetical protein
MDRKLFYRILNQNIGFFILTIFATITFIMQIDNALSTVKGGGILNIIDYTILGLKMTVTMDKYNQVKEGMTYEQVKAILGEGQIISQTKIINAESIMYEWINKDGSNMNGTFSGNKLQAKAQINLK